MTRFRFVDPERAVYPVKLLCRLQKVSRSATTRGGSYHLRRGGSPPRCWPKRSAASAARRRVAPAERRGSTPISSTPASAWGASAWRDHASAGLEGATGAVGVTGRPSGDPDARPAPDLLDRDFSATRAGQEVGRRRHLRLDRAGLALRGDRPRRVLSPNRGWS